jgi:hypothetical protein
MAPDLGRTEQDVNSYDVYLRRDLTPTGGEVWGEPIAHFKNQENAEMLISKLEEVGQKAVLKESILVVPSDEEKELFSDYSSARGGRLPGDLGVFIAPE